jgi:transcription-repair coupling factor (superfamily II helicase)
VKLPEAAALRLRPRLDLAGREREVGAMLDALAGGSVSPDAPRRAVAGLTPPAAALLLAGLPARAPSGKILLLVPGEKEAEQFRSDLSFAAAVLRGPACRVLQFPPLEADPYQGMSPHLGVACERIEALRALRLPGETILVVPTRSLITPLAPPAAFDASRFDLKEKMALTPDGLSAFLLQAGYTRVDMVNGVGEFSRRGGIIDCLTPSADGPVRVEFWGEEVESLRRFDPQTQRSTGRLAAARLDPVREYPWDAPALERLRSFLVERRGARRTAAGSGMPAARVPAARAPAARVPGSRTPAPRAQAAAADEDLAERIAALEAGRPFDGFEACVRLVEPSPASLLDYAPEALVAVWEEGQVLSDLEAVAVDLHASFDLSEEFGMPPPEDLLLPRERLLAAPRRARLRLSELALEEGGKGAPPLRIPCAPPRSYKGRLHDLAADLKTAPPGTGTVFLMESPGRIDRLAEVLREYGLFPDVERPDGAAPPAPPPVPPRSAPAPLRPAPGLLVAPGRLSSGFVLPALGLQVFTEKEVFGEHLEREARPRKVAAFSPGFRDLKAGDLVVHVEHGIGRYAGLMRVGEGGAARDFMVLTYDGNDRLYVPIDRLDLVQRYSGMGGARPKLDRLGGTSWERTQRKVKKAVQEMAADLLRLYAARKASHGTAFSVDGPWQKELEDAFPYEETPDQLRAIEEVRKDMESDLPMDRLICGDVGFGKTEVAMRAAFKAVTDAKQVAVLCPTTVLASQHLKTFRDRFSSWPVTVEMVSRFRSPREQQSILKAVAAGRIDVLVGTHRLLSKDVRFRDLGLLIVDEEQRFGVAHKEAIKAIKKDVDVLTLTATPIPRTLQMSLAGIRDMSVIETPPENRLAIQTSIVPFREGIIAAALRHELKRDGQVYIVHNRVESIASMAKLIRKLVPEARLGVAHGQMGEKLLERTMLSFLDGEFDVLLATTIIENGLDIPRVNTIVVNRADRYGLAQLYQLRGRVGRSDRRAFAYLLVPAKTPLTPVARRRLKALQEFSDLGSGFRIAAMDLEIRGAGNLLGPQQSGHIAAVGFEMYCRLLDEAVREMKGEAPAPERRTQINLGVDIRIPEETVPDFGDRLALYKRISSAAGEAELARIREEIADLYGAVPRQAENLLSLSVLRLMAERLRIGAIDYSGGRVQIRFTDGAAIPPGRIAGVAATRPGVALTPAGVLRLDLQAARGPATASSAAASSGTAAAASGEAARIEAVRHLLQALGPCDSIPPPSQPSAVGPSSREP